MLFYDDPGLCLRIGIRIHVHCSLKKIRIHVYKWGSVFIFTDGEPDLRYTMGIWVHINHGNPISRQNEHDQKN